MSELLPLKPYISWIFRAFKKKKKYLEVWVKTCQEFHYTEDFKCCSSFGLCSLARFSLPVYSFSWKILYECWWLHWGCASISCNVYSHPNPPILQNKDLIMHFVTLSIKVCIVKAMVLSVVLYECESWTIKEAECRRTEAFVLWC